MRSIAPWFIATTLCLSLASIGVAGTGKPTVPEAKGVQCGLLDEALEIFPDRVPASLTKRLPIDVPRNSIAAAHVMIAGLRGTEKITFDITAPKGKTRPDVHWYRMIDVPVAENTGLDRNTEKYSGKVNPYVIRRAPFRIYDPFRPVAAPVTADSSTVVLRVEIEVPTDAKTGTTDYRITITCDRVTTRLDVPVTVHRATLPTLERSTMAYINWHSLDNICTSHGVEKWSEPFWSMLTKYAHMMARGRQNAFWFIWGEYFLFDSSGHVTSFERARLERYIRLFLAQGMTTIHGAPLVGRRDWFGSTDMLLGVKAADNQEVHATSPRGTLMLTEMGTRIVAMMKENHWDKQWLQGIFDEPTDEFVERYKQLVALFRQMDPEIQILEATLTQSVAGSVNVWCPQVHEFQANREFFDQRRVAGDRVWVYTCLAPGGPWLNRLLDMERLRQIYIGWACARFNIQGYLHWGLNHHTPKPFEELVRFHMEGQYLPAGDSHILYPIKEGPLSSHRFEAHRIGMEDYELLGQLKRRDPDRSREIIAMVVQSFDKYKTDVGAYREARRLLLEAVDVYTP
jgi:hypothetical protein